MRKKVGIIIAVFTCLSMMAFSSCGGTDNSGGGNDYVVNGTPNVSGGNVSYEKEEEDSYIKQYSVVFITGDDEVKIPAQTVEEGSKAVAPTISREGYTFLGWYTADGEKWDFATMSVNDHLMLTAWWEKNETNKG